MASRRGTRVLVVQIRQVALASVQPAVGDETCALHRAIPGGEEAAAQTRQTNSGVPLPTGTCRAQSDDDIALRPMARTRGSHLPAWDRPVVRPGSSWRRLAVKQFRALVEQLRSRADELRVLGGGVGSKQSDPAAVLKRHTHTESSLHRAAHGVAAHEPKHLTPGVVIWRHLDVLHRGYAQYR